MNRSSPSLHGLFRQPRGLFSGKRTLTPTTVSPSDMDKINHDQVFFLEYANVVGSLLNGKLMLIRLHEASNSTHNRYFSVIFSSNTDDIGWSTKDNHELTGLINSLYQSFEPVYKNMIDSDVRELQNIQSNNGKYNMTLMPIETIMGHNFSPADKDKYIEALNQLIKQKGHKFKLSEDTWNYIMTFLVGNITSTPGSKNSAKRGRGGASRKKQGKRTRSANTIRRSRKN